VLPANGARATAARSPPQAEPISPIGGRRQVAGQAAAGCQLPPTFRGVFMRWKPCVFIADFFHG
jgi:hypothetical protein